MESLTNNNSNKKQSVIKIIFKKMIDIYNTMKLKWTIKNR